MTSQGEFGYAIHGEEYGFDWLSFVLTETVHPNPAFQIRWSTRNRWDR
jgi:hypothetical protein